MGRQSGQGRFSKSERRETIKTTARNRKPKEGFGEIISIDRAPQRMKPLVPMTDRQEELMNLIPHKSLTFADGVAGTGKSAVTIGVGLMMLFAGEIDQMVLTRSDMSIDGKWAPVPGTEEEKYAHLFAAMRDNFLKFITKSHLENLEKNDKVRFEVLANVLGKTYDRALLIFDEGQCSTVAQTKAFLSRMGKGTRAVIAGDWRDQAYMGKHNGMQDAVYRFRNNPNVGRVVFQVEDIVRDDFVKDVILAYRNVSDSDEDQLQTEANDDGKIDASLSLFQNVA
jgi:phosphate starvation-inducible PhoH-like protein